LLFITPLVRRSYSEGGTLHHSTPPNIQKLTTL